MELEIQKIVLTNGRVPFDEWYQSLADGKARAVVASRLARVRAGNWGDVKSVGQGVFELRIDFGPGFRVYLGRRGKVIVILLGGGDKRTQARDIKAAQKLWKEVGL